jgi:hypothetical protein
VAVVYQTDGDAGLARYDERYADFGPTLAAEYLAQDDGLQVDHETLRRWLLAEGKRSVRTRPESTSRA